MPKIVIDFFAGIGIISTLFYVACGVFMIYEIRHAKEGEDENE